MHKVIITLKEEITVYQYVSYNKLIPKSSERMENLFNGLWANI